MGISIWQLLLILVIVLIVFGGGKLPRVMGDIGKGVRNLKKGLKEDDNVSATPDTLSHREEEPSSASSEKEESKSS